MSELADFADVFGTDARITDNRHADIPDNVRRGLAWAANYFSGQPNTHKIDTNKDSDADADLFRRQIQTYADEHKLTASFPKFVDEHMTKEVVDPDTGKVTKPSKLVPANKVDKHCNVGRNVTFRFSIPKDDSTKASPVTVTPASMAK